ncbi:hypothetical protein EDD90_10412 [Streptomyces sp. Ag109_O5-1]|uniref:hypothetical protein n=1 Tax=Streptomyces sp. Ag109_O5-1 TaxID=1938851 RepID=UPI000FA18777|nr:hypothetical protein EDD90_10412 [Streptomyces sp. Ag109_O5-1]
MPAYCAVAAASAAQLEACRTHPADWTYLSPPALLEPGIRTVPLMKIVEVVSGALTRPEIPPRT